MKVNKLLALCASFFLLTTTISADTIPGRWELVESLRVGTQINVRTLDGVVHSGSFQKLAAEYLLLDESGWQLWVPKSDIQEIARIKEGKKERYTGLGAILGMFSGMAFGLAAPREYNKSVCIVMLGGIGAGTGALIGYATGKAGSEILYTARKDRETTDLQTSDRFWNTPEPHQLPLMFVKLCL